MRGFSASFIFIGLLALSGCGLLMPRPDPNQAWVDLDPAHDSRLHAAEVDERPWDDRRYFQVPPGAHELGMRYQFEVSGDDIGLDSQPHQRDCRLRLRYDRFGAGQRYRLQAGQVGFRAWVKLYDQDDRLLARGQEMRCGGV